MYDLTYVLLLALLVASAAGAMRARKSLVSVLLLSVFSVAITLVFAFQEAVDVAMAEAVIGAGLLTALFVAALGRVGRIS